MRSNFWNKNTISNRVFQIKSYIQTAAIIFIQNILFIFYNDEAVIGKVSDEYYVILFFKKSQVCLVLKWANFVLLLSVLTFLHKMSHERWHFLYLFINGAIVTFECFQTYLLDSYSQLYLSHTCMLECLLILQTVCGNG